MLPYFLSMDSLSASFSGSISTYFLYSSAASAGRSLSPMVSPVCSISPAELPFDLTAKLGEVMVAELKGPVVYYIGAKKEGAISDYKEVYVVTADGADA